LEVGLLEKLGNDFVAPAAEVGIGHTKLTRSLPEVLELSDTLCKVDLLHSRKLRLWRSRFLNRIFHRRWLPLHSFLRRCRNCWLSSNRLTFRGRIWRRNLLNRIFKLDVMLSAFTRRTRVSGSHNNFHSLVRFRFVILCLQILLSLFVVLESKKLREEIAPDIQKVGTVYHYSQFEGLW
jgi:hypothetical protein